MRISRRHLVALAAGLVLATNVTFAEQEHTVAIAGFTYIPGQAGVFGQGQPQTPVTLQVRIGDTITALNFDPDLVLPHTITSDLSLFDSGDVTFDEPKSFIVPNLQPGKYFFRCTHHEFMHGVLEVVE